MATLDDSVDEYLSQVFKQQDFHESQIVAKEFDGCTFSECDLSGTELIDCKFVDCLFVKSNLSNIKLDETHFLGVAFEESKVIGVDWTNASWPRVPLHAPIKFHSCIINDSSFNGLSLSEITIEECKAHDVDFRYGDFSEANFRYTDFSNSLFSKTNLTGADFSEASNYNIDVYLNELKQAKFSRFEAVSLLETLGIELVD